MKYIIVFLIVTIIWHYKVKRAFLTELIEVFGGFCLISILFGHYNYQYLIPIILGMIVGKIF